ncbi:unnamed protein product [Gordionus sp. m RMFG-2023]
MKILYAIIANYIYVYYCENISGSHLCFCDNDNDMNLTLFKNCQNYKKCLCLTRKDGKYCNKCKSQFYLEGNKCKPCPCLKSHSNGECLYTNNRILCTVCKNGFVGNFCNICPNDHYKKIDEYKNEKCEFCNCHEIRNMYESGIDCDKTLIFNCFMCLTSEHRNRCSPFNLINNSLLGNQLKNKHLHGLNTPFSFPFETDNQLGIFTSSSTPMTAKTIIFNLTSVADAHVIFYQRTFYIFTLSLVIVVAVITSCFVVITVSLFIVRNCRHKRFVAYRCLLNQESGNIDRDCVYFDGKDFSKTIQAEVTVEDSDHRKLNNNFKANMADLNTNHEQNRIAVLSTLGHILRKSKWVDRLSRTHRTSSRSPLEPYEELADVTKDLGGEGEENPYRFNHSLDGIGYPRGRPILGFLKKNCTNFYDQAPQTFSSDAIPHQNIISNQASQTANSNEAHQTFSSDAIPHQNIISNQASQTATANEAPQNSSGANQVINSDVGIESNSDLSLEVLM